MNPTDLITQEPFNSVFRIDESVLLEITSAMKKTGFDPAFPIITWNGVVIDGHTRLQAAKDAGVTDVPVVGKEFANEDEALDYAIDCQTKRRQLTDAEIIRLVRELDERRQRGGDHGNQHTGGKSATCAIGKSATVTAKKLGISTRKVEQVRAVIDKATPEVKQAVEAGEIKINAAVKTVTEKKPTAETPLTEDEKQQLAQHEAVIEAGLKSMAGKNADPKSAPFVRPTASQCVTKAMWELDLIKDDDPERDNSLNRIIEYCKCSLSPEYAHRAVDQFINGYTPPTVPKSCKYIVHGYYFAHDKRDVKRMEDIGLKVTRLDDRRKTKPTADKTNPTVPNGEV